MSERVGLRAYQLRTFRAGSGYRTIVRRANGD